MERFFSLSHLTVEQLHSLYLDACKVGTRLIEYDKPGEAGNYELSLSEEEILGNIRIKNENHLVFHEDFDDFPDAMTAVFPLADYPYMTIYVDFKSEWLTFFAQKYKLTRWRQMEGDTEKEYPFSSFYSFGPIKTSLN